MEHGTSLCLVMSVLPYVKYKFNVCGITVTHEIADAEFYSRPPHKTRNMADCCRERKTIIKTSYVIDC